MIYFSRDFYTLQYFHRPILYKYECLLKLRLLCVSQNSPLQI